VIRERIEKIRARRAGAAATPKLDALEDRIAGLERTVREQWDRIRTRDFTR
jgi:hypothetical protein